jgi:DNA ligase-1
MNPQEVVLALAATTKKNEKKLLMEQAWRAGAFEFFLGAKMAYHNQIIFNIKKVPEAVTPATLAAWQAAQARAGDDGEAEELCARIEAAVVANGPGLSWDEFCDLTEALESKRVTGNAAKDAIAAAIAKSDADTWNQWHRRILLKDLRCGVTDKSIDEVLLALGEDAAPLVIDNYYCQLAKNGEDNPRHMKGRKLLDPKLDGYRVQTILNKEEGTISMFFREGNPASNFLPVGELLRPLMERLPYSVVLDGEMVGPKGMAFKEMQKQALRKGGVDLSNVYYGLFDFIPLADWEAKFCPLTQEQRDALLQEQAAAISDLSGGKIYVIDKVEVDLDTEEGQAALAAFNKKALAEKFEGIMVKDPDAPYERDRSVNWLKLKPWITVDLKVVGIKEGTKKNVGKCGSLICEGFDEESRFIRSDVGTGLSDDERVRLWAIREEVIGMFYEITADCVTESENEPGVYSLRFPRNPKPRGRLPGQKI